MPHFQHLLSFFDLTDFWPFDRTVSDLLHPDPYIVPTGCDALIIFTSARPRLESYTNMINTPAGRWQNSLTVFVSVSLPDVKSINYLNSKKKPDAVHRLEESYSSWPPKCSSWRDHISSEWYSELLLIGQDLTLMARKYYMMSSDTEFRNFIHFVPWIHK